MTDRRAIPLLEAATDKRLLGAGIDLFPKQRELLADVEASWRIIVQALGRRSGKTTMAALAALHSCLFRPDLDARMLPGQTRFAVTVATNLQQARVLVQAARAILEASPLLAPLLESSDADELRFRLPDGARTALRAMPCNARGVRGWAISLLAMDEAAHFLSESEGPAVADRVFQALAPATAQFGADGRILVMSTPWGTDGLFADLHAKASSGELPNAIARQATTAEMNPTITAEFLAEEEARDPDGFLSEYLARFEGSGGAYLDFDRFEIADRDELPPEACTHWLAGLDAAFAADPFGCALVGWTPGEAAGLRLGCVRAFVPPKRQDSFEARDRARDEVLDQVAELCLEYGARAVCDQYAAKPVTDRLQRAGVGVKSVPMTATSKTAAFSELRARLYAGSLELYGERDLLAELRRLRTRFTAGAASVVNPRVGGSHGDMAQALAIAALELRGVRDAGGRRPPREFEPRPTGEDALAMVARSVRSGRSRGGGEPFVGEEDRWSGRDV